MPTAEDYQKRAEECRKDAAALHDLAEREALLRIAAQWETLARYKAKRSSDRG